MSGREGRENERIDAGPAPSAPVEQREIWLHGNRVTYLETGARSGGPVVVLLHGLASSSSTWRAALPGLGRHAHVIAPDLLGHGESPSRAAGTTRWARTPSS